MCLERYLHGYNEYMENSHGDNAITVGHCVGIAESTNTLPEYSTTLPVQQTAEHARSDLSKLCLVSGPQNTYISRERQSYKSTKYWTRSKVILQVIIIVQCNRVCSLKIRYIPDKVKLLVA
jgi:hypothetical protein